MKMFMFIYTVQSLSENEVQIKIQRKLTNQTHWVRFRQKLEAIKTEETKTFVCT